jgi:hypothetical protein
MAEAVEVPVESQHAVGLMAPQVGLYQRIGHQPGIGLGHARAGIDRRGKVGEARRINTRTKAHDVSLTWLEIVVTWTDVAQGQSAA